MTKRYNLLSNNQREALVRLIHVEGYTVRQASDLLSINYANAKYVNQVYMKENRWLKKSKRNKVQHKQNHGLSNYQSTPLSSEQQYFESIKEVLGESQKSLPTEKKVIKQKESLNDLSEIIMNQDLPPSQNLLRYQLNRSQERYAPPYFIQDNNYLIKPNQTPEKIEDVQFDFRQYKQMIDEATLRNRQQYNQIKNNYYQQDGFTRQEP